MRCGTSFSETQPLDGLRVDMKIAAQVVNMLAEGIGIRTCERLTGIHRDTVLAILEVVGAKCARLLDEKVKNLKVEQVEVDELFSYVGCRPNNTQANDPKRGEFYCYLSIDRDTKLIINSLIGKRNWENCRILMEDLKQRVPNRFQLSTDGYNPYRTLSGAVFQTFRHNIDYGTEVKDFGPIITHGPRRFNPPVCRWVKRTAIIGEPDLATINTSRVERMNLTMRLFNRRFTRCTMGYSKKLENHKHAASLLIAHYNFCRKHSAHGKTPAMAAGLTDRPWTVKELIEK